MNTDATDAVNALIGRSGSQESIMLLTTNSHFQIRKSHNLSSKSAQQILLEDFLLRQFSRILEPALLGFVRV